MKNNRKLVLISDTHFGARNNSIEFERHFFRFYDNVFFPFLDKNQSDITAIWHLGDVVDKRRTVDYRTLSTFSGFVDRLCSYGIPIEMLVGNHDAYYRNTNDLNALNELFSGYNGINVWKNPAHTYDGKVLILPWITNSNQKVAFDLLNTTKSASVVFGHLEINGFEMHRGGGPCISGTLNQSDLKRFDLVISGHFHHRSRKGNIQYLGSPYQMTWSDHGDVFGFHVFDIDTLELTFIENPHTMFHVLTYDNGCETISDDCEGKIIKVVVKKRDNHLDFENFIKKLESYSPVEITVVDSGELDVNLDDEKIIEVPDTINAILSEIEDPNQANIVSDLYKRAIG